MGEARSIDPRRRRAAITGGLALALASCTDGGVCLTATTAPILGGTRTTGDPAVVALVRGDAVVCTGTVVAPGAVVTAAHCVISGEGALRAPDRIELSGGETPDGQQLAPAWVATHPGYHHRYFLEDIAIIGLAEDAVIPPIAPASRAPSGTLRLVGFGLDEPSGSAGVKRTASTPLIGADLFSLVHAPLTCHGDSGGAVLAWIDGAERLVGVVSHGPAICGDAQGTAFATRVDVVADWLDELLAAEPSTGPDGRCVLADPSDPDCTCVSDGRCQTCPDRVDPDCGFAPLGARCDAEAPCERGAVCVGGACELRCSPGAHGCPLGLTCVELQPELTACMPAEEDSCR